MGVRILRWFGWVCALILVLGGTLAAFGQDASIGAGFQAGFTCSAVFTAGRNPLDVMREELTGVGPVLVDVAAPVVDYEHQAVFVSYADDAPPRMAVHRGDLGTVLAPVGWTLADVDKLPWLDLPDLEGDPAEIAWPNGDLIESAPLPDDVDEAVLNTAIDAAFSPTPTDRFMTTGVVVVYQGRIIAERYAPGWGPRVQYRTWSTGKSLMNALVGILVRDGKLTVDQPASISAWPEGDPRCAITIENLLHMSSGLESEGAMTLQGYWGGIDTADDAASQRLDAEPGTLWKYANYDTLLLARSMREVLGDQETYLAFPYVELLHKIGMRDTTLEVDPYGNFIISSQNYTTCRDLARFGMLYLNDGVWNGERILPEGWIDYTCTPAEAHPEKRYGAQFWLYGQTDSRLPKDVYSTAGSRGQYSTIVPSRNLVVARMGLDPIEEDTWDHSGFVASIIAAVGNP